MDSTEAQGKDFFKKDASSAEVTAAAQEGVSWTASEYIHHSKTASWYVIAFAVVIISALVGFLLTRDYFTPGAIVVLGFIMLVVGSRKPRTLNYAVDMRGILVGVKEYAFNDFQSFSIIQEGPIESIMLIPLKRWAPAINLYFAPEDGQKIFDTLSNFLPFEQRERDVIDKFLYKIRF